MDDELRNMSVEDFCKAIGITEKRFNKKLKKAKSFLVINQKISALNLQNYLFAHMDVAHIV